MSLLRRMILPALASVVFFVSCQGLTGRERGPSAEDSLRVALHLGAGADTVDGTRRSGAKWLRVQFEAHGPGGRSALEPGLVLDTLVPNPSEDFVTPPFPKTHGYSATVSGLDGTFRKVWGGGATRHAPRGEVEGDVTVALAVPLLAQEPLPQDSLSMASGRIDFPRTVRFPRKVAPGTQRVCSFDSVTWSPCPKRVRIDSSLNLFVQTRSLDTLIGAPFSPVLKARWEAKPVAAPVARIKRHEDLPGSPWRVTLRSGTRGARMEWSADSGRTWKRYGGRFRIRSGKTYLARALKKHQGESPVTRFALRRTARGLVLVDPSVELASRTPAKPSLSVPPYLGEKLQALADAQAQPKRATLAKPVRKASKDGPDSTAKRPDLP